MQQLVAQLSEPDIPEQRGACSGDFGLLTLRLRQRSVVSTLKGIQFDTLPCSDVFSDAMKRATVCFEGDLHKALKMKAAETSVSVAFPIVTMTDLGNYPDMDSLRRAYPEGYRLTDPFLPGSAKGGRIRQADVHAERKLMEEQEDRTNACTD